MTAGLGKILTGKGAKDFTEILQILDDVSDFDKLTDVFKIMNADDSVIAGILGRKGFTEEDIVAATNAVHEFAASGKGIEGLQTAFLNLGKAAKNVFVTLATNPLTWLVAGTAAIIALEDALTVSYKEAHEALDKSSSAYNETTENLKSMEEKAESYKTSLSSIAGNYELNFDGIDSVSEMIDTLESADLTLEDQIEVDKIKSANDELERQIALEERLQEIRADKLVEDAKVAADTGDRSVAQSVKMGDSSGQKNFRGEVKDITDTEEIKNTISLIRQYEKELPELQQKVTDAEEAANKADPFTKWFKEFQLKDAKDQVEHYNESLETLYNNLDTRSANVQQNLDALKLDPVANADAIKELEEALDLIAHMELSDEEIELDNLETFFSSVSGKYLKEGLIKNYKDIQNVISDGNKNILSNLESEKKKISDWGLDEYSEDILSGSIQSKFGNVDMDKRSIITWNEEMKQTYKNALDSWNYDPEVGSIDTVFGGSSRFGEDVLEKGVEVAFTPIMDGKLLDKNTVYDYINELVGESVVDGKFSEERLLSLDKQGKQIGDTFISGLIAAADEGLNYDNNGNWAEVTGRLMHFSGDFGAISLAYNEIDKAAKKAGVRTEDFVKLLEGSSDSTEALENSLKSMGLTLEDMGIDNISTLQQYLQEIVGSANQAEASVSEFSATLADVGAAFESANAGADYSTAFGYFQKAQELFNAGDVGTDDFQKTVEYFTKGTSFAKIADNYKYDADAYVAAWTEAQAKIQRYFTENPATGINNAVDDLITAQKAFVTSEGDVEWGFKSSAEAAQALGISVEATEDILGKLKDQGAEFDDVLFSYENLEKYKSSLEGIRDIYGSMSQGEEKERLGKLIEGWDKDLEGFETHLDTLTEDQIIHIEFEYQMAQLRSEIEELQRLADEGDESAKAALNMKKGQYIEDRMANNGFDIEKDDSYKKSAEAVDQLHTQLYQATSKEQRDQIQDQISNIYDLQMAFQEAFADDNTIDWESFLGSDRAQSVIDNILEKTGKTKKELAKDLNLAEDALLPEQHIKIYGEFDLQSITERMDELKSGSTIKFDAVVDDAEQEITALKEADGSITYTAEVDGVEKEVSAITHLDGSIEFSTQIDSSNVEQKMSELEEGTTITFQADVNGAQTEVQALKTVDGSISYSTNINGVKQSLNTVKNEDGTITYTINEVQGTQVEEETDSTVTKTVNEVPGTLVETAKTITGTANFELGTSPTSVPDASGKANYTLGTYPTILPAATQHVVRTVTEKKADLTGTAHVSGTLPSHHPMNRISGHAFASGSLQDSSWVDPKWRTKTGNIALTGEVGREMVVDPSTNSWWTVGDDGAEFAYIPPGAVVFNDRQTEDLLSRGATKSRGSAYLSGTAYANGWRRPSGSSSGSSGGSSGSSSKRGSGSGSGNSGNSGGNSDAAEEAFEEIKDWVEVYLERQARITERLTNAIEDAVGLNEKQAATNKAIAQVQAEIAANEKGAARYQQQANSVDLAESYKNQVRNGTINIETITDENLKEKIEEFTEWYF